MSKNRIIKFIGNLRIYSLIDLILLFYVIGARGYTLVGGICLWLFFLLYLEWQHEHTYREKVPSYTWILFLILGLLLYFKIAGILFTILVLLYTRKNKGYWGLLSPLLRGLQMVVLTMPFFGLYSIFPWIVGILMSLRNLLGDFRDGEKDAKEGLKTIPVILGIKKNIPYVHLISVMLTTFIWWNYDSLPYYVVIFMWIIQYFTYKFTPR